MSYYLMHRGWMDNPIFRDEPLTHASAWIWLIENAAFTITKHHGKVVERGQLYTSLGRLARVWKWRRAKVQRYLHTLCRENMTDTASDTDGTLITICNYNKYQVDPKTGKPPPDTDPIQTRYRPDTRNKEGKKEERDSRANALDAFEEFWRVYPPRGKHPNPKKPARLKFELAVKHGVDPNEIVSGARRFAQQVWDLNTEPKFISQAVTWLNQEGWSDAPVSNGHAPDSPVLPFGGGPPGPAPTLEELKVRMERSEH